MPLLFLAIVVSGCLGGSSSDLGATNPFSDPFQLHCIEDGSIPSCAATMPGRGVAEGRGEPTITIDPTNPARVAIGMISAAPPTTGAAHMSKLQFFLSEDGASTWNELQVPPVFVNDAVPLRLRSDSDPGVAFDQQGVLHIVGLATRVGTIDGGGSGHTSRVFHAATTDLGQTWIGPTVLGDGVDNSRPWLGLGADGTAVVTWQTTTGNRDMQAAWSMDKGTSWTQTQVRGSCNLVSQPIVKEGVFLAACYDRSGAHCELPILEISMASRAGIPIGCAPGPVCGNNLLTRLGDEGLVWACPNGWMATSPNGGRNWTAAVNLLSRISLDVGGQGFSIFALKSDPGGFLHILVANYAAVALPSPPGGGYSAGHVVLDPTSWLSLSETMLTDNDSAGPMTDFKGEYAGLAFHGDRGLATWVDRDHAVRVVGLQPPTDGQV